LESLADSLSLRDQIRFLGYIPDPELPLYYQAADVFVLPTRELEGFGLITVEALACGTPTVGTNVGAIPEILLSLNPSLVLRDATPEVLAEGLKRYFDDFGRDSSSVTLLRQACRRHAETQYTWDSSIQKIEGVLLDLSRAKGYPAYDKALIL
jgi:glycosyltransferase involved in cell wall biosynthesis